MTFPAATTTILPRMSGIVRKPMSTLTMVMTWPNVVLETSAASCATATHRSPIHPRAGNGYAPETAL
jgi:hypothetical protein